MSAIRRIALGATALLFASACGESRPADVPEPPTELGAELLAELWRLGSVLTPRLFVMVAVVLAVLLGARRGLTIAVRVAWRLGWDGDRSLARIRSWIELMLLAVGTLLVLREVFRVVPLLTSVSLVCAALVAALALPGGLQDLAAGVSLTTRNRFLEGDQIEVAGYSGTVRHIGLLRSMLRLPDGRTLWLPNREIVRSAVQVGREQQALPVSVSLPVSCAGDPELRERLRRVAHLSPYRRAGSRPIVSEDEGRFVLTIQTWCTRRPEVAARALDRQLRAMARRWDVIAQSAQKP